jgi:carbon dioxide concentrating mechanism protein CcmM
MYYPNTEIENTAFIHPFAVIIGACYIGELVMVAPTSVYSGDECTPIHIC